MLCALCFVLLLTAGCASVTQTLTTQTVTTNGVIETKTTKSRIAAFWDAKNTIDKLRVSNGKTHSIGIAEAGNESSSTNITYTIDALTRLLQSIK